MTLMLFTIGDCGLFCLSQGRIFGLLVPTPKHRRNKYSQYLCMNYAVLRAVFSKHMRGSALTLT